MTKSNANLSPNKVNNPVNKLEELSRPKPIQERLVNLVRSYSVPYIIAGMVVLYTDGILGPS